MEKESLKVKNFTSTELKSLLSEDENFQQAIRLFACYQVSLGMHPYHVASFYKTSVTTICSWVKRLNEDGIEGLVDKETNILNEVNKDISRSITEIFINKQPFDHGFNRSVWTWSTFSKLIIHQFQLGYRQTQISNILYKLRLKFKG